MDDTVQTIRCACGWEAQGTLEDLVEAATDHGRQVHNMTPTRDEVMAMVVPIEAGRLDGPAGSGA